MPSVSVNAIKFMSFLGLSKPRAFQIYSRYLSNYAFIHINKCGGTSIERALGIPGKNHDTALERRKVLRGRWEKLYKFSVVRHPYNRVESLYRYRVKTNQNLMKESKISLDDWIREVWVEKNPEYYDQPKMFAPCHFWLSNEKGDIIVDDVIKLEQISSHWQRISSRTGANDVLERLNQTVSDNYAAKLSMNASNRTVIQNAFEKDFQVFDYKS